jgi:hypothetical protein
MKKITFLLIAIVMLITMSCSIDPINIVEVVDGNSGISISGEITEDLTLTSNNDYFLNDALVIKDGATLTIEAGTQIIARSGGTSVYLLIEAGAKIEANGTASDPIRFTSSNQSPASWGGIIINGKAIISGQTAGVQAGTEVNAGILFGGSDDADSSGSMQYVIIEYTGAAIDGNAEHNGLTLNGVGSGTTLSNIWIANGDDDGIEFFGGSVNASNIFVLNAKDDMFDFTQGYRGTCTNLYGIRENGYNSVTSDPRGIEADGNLDGNSPTDINQSNFTINGLTLRHEADGVDLSDLIKVRRGATATINNALAGTFGTATTSDFIDLEDLRGDSTAATVINATANGTADGTDIKNSPGATVTVTGTNTGTDASLFAWTGYMF